MQCAEDSQVFQCCVGGADATNSKSYKANINERNTMLKLTVEIDEHPECPLNDTEWKLYSFSQPFRAIVLAWNRHATFSA